MPPKPKVPKAALSFVASDDYHLTLSTDGTKPAPSSHLSGWVIAWGDTFGSAGSGPPPTLVGHTYASDGLFEVSLTVHDQNGRSGEMVGGFIVRRPLTPPNATAPDLLARTDITYLGAFLMPTSGVDTYSGTNNYAITGRKVAGEYHLFVYGGTGIIPVGTVSSAASSSVFTLGAGQGASFTAGDQVSIRRASRGDVLPEATRISTIVGDVITVSPALGGTPKTSVSTTMASVSSSTVFTVAAGLGASFAVGDLIRLTNTAATLSANRVISLIAGDQLTIDQAITSTYFWTLGIGDYVERFDNIYRENDPVYELVDPCQLSTTTPDAVYKLDYTTAPRATLYASWGDVYQGHRVQYYQYDNTIVFPDTYQYAAGLYWNPSTNLLYWGYYNAYNSTRQPLWCVGATSLDNPGTLAMTSYGPWRMQVTDVDGQVRVGAERTGFFWPEPSGTMGTHGLYFVSTVGPWGPQYYGGLSWPTGATPAGPTEANLTVPNRYLDYYFMGDSTGANYFNTDGSLHGTLRSFKRPAGTVLKYIFELAGHYPQILWSDPAQTGYYTWTWTDSLAGGWRINGPNKRALIFAGRSASSSITDSSNCAAAHTWYTNNGQGDVTYSGLTGTFVAFETITGGTSGASAFLKQSSPSINRLDWSQSPIGADFTVGETLTGGTSGATCVVTVFHRYDKCDHYCSSPVVIAGPVSRAYTPTLYLFDPDALTANASDSYTADAYDMIDMLATYGVQAGQVSLSQGAFGGIFVDDRDFMYLTAPGGDHSRFPSNPNVFELLVHVFKLST